MPRRKRKTRGVAAFIYTRTTEEVPLNVESVDFSPCVIEVRQNAFRFCNALRYLILNEGLQRIGPAAFRDCRSLDTLVKLPSTVIDIGDRALYGCKSLRDVFLNEGLQKIGSMAFSDCQSLEHVTLPSTVIEVEGEAFWGCATLRNLVLNEGLKKIGDGAFCECDGMEKIELPSTIDEIGACAFDRCTALRDVVLNHEGPLPKIGIDAFHGCTSLESVKFPYLSIRFKSISTDLSRADVLKKIQQVHGVTMVGSEILISGTPLKGGDDWTKCKESLDQILGLITYYELKEATSVFELALWKEKIMEKNLVNSAANRESCCIEAPGPLKDCVLQYFTYSQKW